ncbi:MAG: CAP domain-containing protein, partial [Polyangiaceae bacterium]
MSPDIARLTGSRGLERPAWLVAVAMSVGCSSPGSTGFGNDFGSGDDAAAAGSGSGGAGSGGSSGGTADDAAGGSSGSNAGGSSSGSGSGSSGTTVHDAGSTGHPGTLDSGAAPDAATSSTPVNCPAPPSGAPANAVQAQKVLNATRVAAGSGCMNLVATLDTSAQAYCTYEATNASNASCVPQAHTEVSGCTGFTGADVQTREVAAGYPQSMAYTEVATSYGNNPTAAVPSWIDTVFHRIPLLDPWTVDMGYGGATGCDAIDIGRGMSSAAAKTVVVYPYDGQTNVPPSFSGLEGPTPPAPSGGFPSAYPINIYAQNLSVTQHVLTKDGD